MLARGLIPSQRRNFLTLLPTCWNSPRTPLYSLRKTTTKNVLTSPKKPHSKVDMTRFDRLPRKHSLPLALLVR